MKLFSSAEIRRLEELAGEEGVSLESLMEQAGTAVAVEAEKLLHPLEGKRVAILCGKGNNGGDGFVIARAAAKEGWKMGGGHPARYLESVARLRQLRQMPVTELLSYKNRPLRAGLDLMCRVSARRGWFVLSEFCHPQAGSHRFLFQEMA